MAEPALKREEQEAAWTAQFSETQARLQRAQATGGQDWRPANAPIPGATGALGRRPTSEDELVQPANNNRNFSANNNYNFPGTLVPESVIEPPDEEANGAEEEQRAEEEALDQDAAAAELDASQARSAVIQQASAAEEGLKAQGTKAAKEEGVKLAKKYAPKLLNWLGGAVDGFAGISDTSTVGTSFIWDFIFYTITFTWWNAMMIYGYYISGYFINKKNENPLVPPLTWNQFNLFEEGFTIPLPDVCLHILLVAADIWLVIAIVVLLGLAAIVAILVIDFWQNPTGTLYTIIVNPSQLPYFQDLAQLFGL